jgi:alkylation response protein AidB-like acyl-CoA dehydrogenase
LPRRSPCGGARLAVDLTYTPDEERFRGQVRAWLETHLPRADERHDPARMKRWHRDLHAAGFIGCSWPREYGGGGLTDTQQAILHEELARADAPAAAGGMGVLWVGPAIIRFGSDAQKRRFIPPILAGDETWCTGYSEPNAGSDLASLGTRAERHGDHFLVNGQKIWTTIAHLSDWCFLLVRTSSDGPKHAGLTILLVDMKSPGIEVRPLRQITGDAEFNEVFLQDVRVPVDNRLGDEGQGWAIVRSALVDERSGMATAIRVDRVLADLIATVRQSGLAADPLWRQRVAALAIECEIVRHANLRQLSDQLNGRLNPGLASALKLMCSELNQRLTTGGHEAEGAVGLLFPGGGTSPDRRSWTYRMLYDRCLTIAGGTSEVQRGVIAQRVLGLPR